MRPGEYVGQDGRTYRWTADLGTMHMGKMRHQGQHQDVMERYWIDDPIDSADWPAAKAALDALIEEEAGEWVVVGDQTRLTLDGTRVQTWHPEYGWENYAVDDAGNLFIVMGYRKGREVALEQVRELVEAVEAWEALLIAEKRTGYMSEQAKRMVALAKKVSR